MNITDIKKTLARRGAPRILDETSLSVLLRKSGMAVNPAIIHSVTLLMKRNEWIVQYGDLVINLLAEPAVSKAELVSHLVPGAVISLESALEDASGSNDLYAVVNHGSAEKLDTLICGPLRFHLYGLPKEVFESGELLAGAPCAIASRDKAMMDWNCLAQAGKIMPPLDSDRSMGAGR